MVNDEGKERKKRKEREKKEMGFRVLERERERVSEKVEIRSKQPFVVEILPLSQPHFDGSGFAIVRHSLPRNK